MSNKKVKINKISDSDDDFDSVYLYYMQKQNNKIITKKRKIEITKKPSNWEEIYNVIIKNIINRI